MDRRRRSLLGGRNDFRDRLRRVLVAALEPLKVHHRQSPAPAQLDREARVDYGVEGRREDRKVEGMLAYAKLDIRQLWVNGDASGHDGNLVEPVSGAELPVRRQTHFVSVPLSWKPEGFQTIYQSAVQRVNAWRGYFE